jgi:ribose 5-phosphate isomerase B
MFKIAIGSDDAGYNLKTVLFELLQVNPKISSVIDIGINKGEKTFYPSVAFLASEKVRSGQVDRAILICGTGIGMHISANKVPGIRATVAHDSYSVKRSILSNNCQILTFGAKIIDIELAKKLTLEWLTYEFDKQSLSASKVDEITKYESGVS